VFGLSAKDVKKLNEKLNDMSQLKDSIFGNKRYFKDIETYEYLNINKFRLMIFSQS